jgi:hypothetical protein
MVLGGFLSISCIEKADKKIRFGEYNLHIKFPPIGRSKYLLGVWGCVDLIRRGTETFIISNKWRW